MKRFFEAPEIEILKISVEDIVSASPPGGFQPGEDETEPGGGL